MFVAAASPAAPRSARLKSKTSCHWHSDRQKSKVSSQWQSDSCLEVHQKLDRLDSQLKLLSSASASSMMKLARKLDDLSFRLQVGPGGQEVYAEGGTGTGDYVADGHEWPEGFEDHNVSSMGGTGCAESRYEVPRTYEHLLPVTGRSEESLPLPIGDLLVVDWPIWDTVKKPPAPLPEDDASELGIDNPVTAVVTGSSIGNRRRQSSLRSMTDLKLKAEANATFLGAMWNFLDDPDSGCGAKIFAVAMPYVILCSVLLAVLQQGSPPMFVGTSATILNVVFEGIFLVELLLRGISCPAKKAFLYDYNNVADVLAVVPLFIRLCFGFRSMEGGACGPVCIGLMCATPLLRALKSLRRFETLPLLIEALQGACDGLPVCMFVLFVLILFFGPLLYLVEPRDNIASVPTAMWLTIVTMTTVGYGDITPSTTAGSLIVSALVILSVLYMAMPLGIIGNAFSEVWQERDFILLRYRTQAKFASWGYAPHDIPALFNIFAEDGTGELQLNEFVNMLTEMRMGLQDSKIVKLFDALDEDEGGSIDDREFIKRVFPDAYSKLYKAEKEAMSKSTVFS